MKQVSVIGLGYIGLPTAIVIAQSGFKVTGFDINADRVARINAGQAVMNEPELIEKLHAVQHSGLFHASNEIAPADYFIIAVPTPLQDTLDEAAISDKKADMSYVFKAADSIATVLKQGDVVILESTVLVGTTEKLARYLAEITGLRAGQDFFCAHSPERVLPGNIFYELVNNPRVIGGINQESVDRTYALYRAFVRAPLHVTRAATAEMVKLIENSYRDVQIAFAHQVAEMAHAQKVDPYELIELANKHPRVNILRPTCGVGGHCIAIDPWFLVETFPEETALLRQARETNNLRPKQVALQIRQFARQFEITQKRRCNILLLGATYKPDVEDLRESPALHIAHDLMRDQQIKVCEPYIDFSDLRIAGLTCVTTFSEGIAWADVIVSLVAHTTFKKQNQILREHVVLDFCGLLYQEVAHVTPSQQIFWPAHTFGMPHEHFE